MKPMMLKEYIANKGMTQEQFAKKININTRILKTACYRDWTITETKKGFCIKTPKGRIYNCERGQVEIISYKQSIQPKPKIKIKIPLVPQPVTDISNDWVNDR